MQRASDQVDSGSLGAAVNAAATDEELSAADRAQLAFYLTTEIADEFAADADQLSATTYDDGDYFEGDQNAVTNGYDAVPKLLFLAQLAELRMIEQLAKLGALTEIELDLSLSDAHETADDGLA